MRRTLVILLFASFALFGEGPEFDVASIKPTPANPNGFIVFGPQRGGPGTPDPTHINWTSAALRNVVMAAFDVRNYQVAGPDDLDQLRFDFAVGLPEGATKEQAAVMWRNLLLSRLGLKYHIEQREFNVDELQIGPKGHKLVEDKTVPPAQPAEPAPPPGPPGPPPMDKDGRPVMNSPGLMMFMTVGPNGPNAKITGNAQPMSELVKLLSNQLGNPVVDKTGLAGKYDFYVEFAPTRGIGGLPFPAGGRGAPAGPGVVGTPPTPGAEAELGLELPQALEQQLGLHLAKGKGMLDVIVVEKINRVPTEN